MATPYRPTRIEWLSGHGWVVRALDGHIVAGPILTRSDARVAAKRYRLTGLAVDNLRSADESISRTIGLITR